MITKIMIFAALLILAMIFQTFFASLISLDRVMPDIYVILVVYLTLSQGLTHGLVFGFAAGLIESSTDPHLFGLGALLKIIVALVVFFFSTRLRLESNYTRVLIVLFAVAVHNVLYYLVAYGLDIEHIIYWSLKYALLDAIYSALVTVVLIYLSERKLTLKFDA